MGQLELVVGRTVGTVVVGQLVRRELVAIEPKWPSSREWPTWPVGRTIVVVERQQLVRQPIEAPLERLAGRLGPIAGTVVERLELEQLARGRLAVEPSVALAIRSYRKRERQQALPALELLVTIVPIDTGRPLLLHVLLDFVLVPIVVERRRQQRVLAVTIVPIDTDLVLEWEHWALGTTPGSSWANCVEHWLHPSTS